MAKKVVSADEARKNFAELLNTATFGNGRIQIMRRGKVAGYIIGPKDMSLLESAEIGEAGQEEPQIEMKKQDQPLSDETASWEELKEELGEGEG